MSGISWIKITVDMFENRKVKHLRKLPEGNCIVLIWVMLLTLAGRCNAGGMIFLTESIPYTAKMLADELDFEESTVRTALEGLERLNMVVPNGSFLQIVGWASIRTSRAWIRSGSRIGYEKLPIVNDKSSKKSPCHVTVT